MALPTQGRVIIETTVGELDIELWSKETPRTCRNFIALALEGYYDGVIFHRIIPGFLVQTGDRSGTGSGGESFYGEPFEDEIHPRLRYSHRGLVGMANNGTKNSNDSQFFITLDRADELHGKHTLFGRCMGDTVYNAMKIGEMEIDKDGRPVYPPRIKSIRVVDNPFPDIIPRITAAERRAQLRAREDAQREREEDQRRRGAKKNTKLLSFGADEDEEAGAEPEPAFKKKAIFRPDLMDDPQAGVGMTVPDFVTNARRPITVPAPAPASVPEEVPNAMDAPASAALKSSNSKGKGKDKSKSKDKGDDITKIRERHAEEHLSASDARRAQIEQMEAEIRKLSNRRSTSPSSSSKKKPVSYLAEELAKYSSGRRTAVLGGKGKGKGRKGDENEVLAALDGFRERLRSTMLVDEEGEGDGEMDVDVDVPGSAAKNGEEGASTSKKGRGGVNEPSLTPAPATPKEAGTEGNGEETGVEVDADVSFMTHALHFPVEDAEEAGRRAERDYEVIDPRARGALAREEERERKRAKRGGGRGGERHGRGGERERGERGQGGGGHRYHR